VRFRESIVAVFLAALLTSLAALAVRADGQAGKVKGYVLDSACAFTKDLKKPVSVECAIACAKQGSPLVILTDDGHIYWPISGKTPASGQNERLLKFAGQRVVATGKIYEREGARAIVIDTVEAETAGKK
jgi:hypothetical protein